MAVKRTIKTVWQIRRDITENWLLNKNTIPAAGEPCYDLKLHTLKIGDGKTSYENLPIIGYVESGDVASLQAEINALKNSIETLQTDVDNVEDNVSDIQDQVGETNIVEVKENITELQTVVNQKADVEAVEILETELKTYIEEQIKTVGITNIDDGEI